MRRAGTHRTLLRGSLLGAAVLCSCSARAIDQATVDRVRTEIARYAQRKGESLEQYLEQVGSPLWHVESFVYTVEQGGGTAEDALDRLDQFVAALSDPMKRELLRCAGIRVPRDVDPAPSPAACAALEQRFGAP